MSSRFAVTRVASAESAWAAMAASKSSIRRPRRSSSALTVPNRSLTSSVQGTRASSRPDEIEAFLQRLPAFRSGEPLDAVRDLRHHRVRNADIRAADRVEPRDDARVAPHEGRHRVRVEDVPHHRIAALDRRPLRIARIMSSTSLAVRASTCDSRSKKPGDQSEPSRSSRSSARTTSWFLLMRRARARRSTAWSSVRGRCTLVGMTIWASIQRSSRRASPECRYGTLRRRTNSCLSSVRRSLSPSRRASTRNSSPSPVVQRSR